MKWEVRTMRSGTSFFDLTLYRKTVNRFWPLWAVNLVIWLFILPLNGLVQLGDDPYGSSKSLLRFARNVGDCATQWGIIFAVFAGLVVAMAVCSHLYNNRSANFMGSLPIRREGQFVSTYLAGLTILIGPNLLIFLLTLLVETIGGVVMWVPLLFWLAALCAMEFFFYSFAVCLGQFAGHILALPVYFGIFNFIVIAVYAMFQWVMEVYYFGFSGGFDSEGLVLWFTPIIALFQMDIDVVQENNGPWITDVEGLWIAGVYAIVAVVLTVCALLLYRRRHLETAGDIVAVKAMRPVFRYGVGFCAGMFLGWLTDQILSLGEFGLLIAVLIWGVIGCFVAQMLLDKTIRVFKKWKGCAALVAVFLVIFAVIGFDLTGYETRVPNPANVESVQVTGLQGYPWDSGATLHTTFTDPETIEDVVALHQAIVDFGERGEQDNYGNSLSYTLTYHLKSGGTVSRSYHVRAGKTLLKLAQKIRDRDEVRYKAYGLDEVEEFLAAGGELDWAALYPAGQEELRFHVEDAEALWNAVMADFEARTIGVHTVNEYDGTLEEKTDLIWIGDYLYAGAEIEFRWVKPRPADEKETRTVYLQIVVREDSANTLKVLEQLLTVDNRYQDDPNDNPLWRAE